MTEIGEREKTAREIARMRASIRKKHRALKTGKLEDEITLETRFKPIVEPLRRIAEHAERNVDDRNAIKLETTDVTPIKRKWKDDDSVAHRDDTDVSMHAPIQREKIAATKRLRELRRERSSSLPIVASTPTGTRNLSPSEQQIVGRDLFGGEKEDEVFETGFESPPTLETSVRRTLHTPQGRETLHSQLGPLGRKYVGSLLSGEATSEMDNVYGVYLGDEGMMLGDKRFDVDVDDAIIVGDVRYVGTPGLYELIFKRIPDDLVYTENDKLTYRNILLKTNAHKRDHKATMPVLGNKGHKYKYVIAPLLQSVKKVGAGRVPSAMRVTGNRIDYVHWDDPNELVDRLRLLDSSRRAGNNAHDNEILSILEELREAGLIIN